ncbi:MAG: lipopolysaccharide heptosyltransferase II [Pyrinomonadaceae bacterium]
MEMAETEGKKIDRIIVRGTNWVGDAVMTVPALRELRRIFPKAHITLATRSWARDLFEDADFLNEVLVHERTGVLATIGQVRQWREGRFDLAVLLPNSFQSALVACLAGVPIRIAYATDNRRALLTHPLNLPEWRGSKHEVFYYLQIVAEIERQVNHQQTFLDMEPDGSLQVADSRKSAATNFLRAHGITAISDGRPLVALCPGSINSRAKRWPAERYASLADRLIDEQDAHVILIGAAGETEISLRISEQMHAKPVMLTGRTDLKELVAILSLIDLLITNDTGPAHIASALGRPTLVIFGPTNPLTTRPFSPLGDIVQHPPDCAPCMLRDCPIDHRCMTAITPGEVFDRARILLGRQATSDNSEFIRSCPTRLSEAINRLKFAGLLK